MLNDVWSGLVNEVEATKKHYEDLEGNAIQANGHLIDGIDALIKRVEELGKKSQAIDHFYNNLHNTFTKQQQTICQGHSHPKLSAPLRGSIHPLLTSTKPAW